MKLSTRLKIVGWEVVFLGAFLLGLVALQVSESGSTSNVESFAWVYGIVAVTLALVGLEAVSLVRKLPSDQ